MDLWVIMSLFGTVLVTLGILSFIPGAATYIASFFQVITSFLRQGIQIVVDHLPKPLKLVLFVVLFVVLGGVAYNFTIGAPYICQSMACEQKIGTNATLCAQSNVVQTDWLTGVAFKILPHEDMVKWWSDQSKQQAVAAQANNMSATEPRVILNVEVSPGSSGTANVSTGRGLVTEDKNFVWKGDGNTYHVYRVLGAYFEDWVNLGDDFFTTNVANIWDTWSENGGVAGSRVAYAICYDSLTTTCTLKRDNCGGPLKFVGVNIPGTIGTDMYARTVGHIEYFLSGGQLTGIYEGAENGQSFYDNMIRVQNLWKNPKMCKDVGLFTESDISNFLAKKNVLKSDNRYDAYSEVLSVKSTVDLISSQSLLDVTSLDTPIYYTAHAPIWRTLVSIKTSMNETIAADTTFTNLQEVSQGEQNPLDHKIIDLLFEGKSVPPASKNAPFSVICDDSTSDPYDTKPLMFGIDILNWKIMALLVSLGAILSFYSWYKGFWS